MRQLELMQLRHYLFIPSFKALVFVISFKVCCQTNFIRPIIDKIADVNLNVSDNLTTDCCSRAWHHLEIRLVTGFYVR